MADVGALKNQFHKKYDPMYSNFKKPKTQKPAPENPKPRQSASTPTRTTPAVTRPSAAPKRAFAHKYDPLQRTKTPKSAPNMDSKHTPELDVEESRALLRVSNDMQAGQGRVQTPKSAQMDQLTEELEGAFETQVGYLEKMIEESTAAMEVSEAHVIESDATVVRLESACIKDNQELATAEPKMGHLETLVEKSKAALEAFKAKKKADDAAHASTVSGPVRVTAE